MIETPLDRAHRAMEAAPDQHGPRIRFYGAIAASELFVLLDAEPAGGKIVPSVFPVDDQKLALAFDTEERLADFTGKATHFATLSGRKLLRILAEGGLSFGLNLDVAPSSILLPPETIQWIIDRSDSAPSILELSTAEFSPPADIPESVLLALETALGATSASAETAYLVRYSAAGKGAGDALCFQGARTEDYQALVAAVTEAMAFSGIEAGSVDVTFLDAGSPLLPLLERNGLRIELPKPAAPDIHRAPGSNPEKPPRLR